MSVCAVNGWCSSRVAVDMRLLAIDISGRPLLLDSQQPQRRDMVGFFGGLLDRDRKVE